MFIKLLKRSSIYMYTTYHTNYLRSRAANNFFSVLPPQISIVEIVKMVSIVEIVIMVAQSVYHESIYMIFMDGFRGYFFLV